MNRLVIDEGRTRDGLVQARRHWLADDPHAAVLVVHGMAEHSGRYEHVGAFWAERGLEVVAIDLRGFGRSGGRRAHVDRFDDFLDDVEDQLLEVRALGLPTTLLGHSMGGLIAAAYGTSGRPQPDRLVLSAPALAAEIAPWQRLLAPVLGAVAPRFEVPDSAIDTSVLSTDPGVGEAYLADPLVTKVATAGLGKELFATMDAVADRVDRLRVPTLVVHGGDDTLVPPSASAPLAEVAGVERIEYPGLRHEVLNEPVWRSIATTIADWILTPKLGAASSPH